MYLPTYLFRESWMDGSGVGHIRVIRLEENFESSRRLETRRFFESNRPNRIRKKFESDSNRIRKKSKKWNYSKKNVRIRSNTISMILRRFCSLSMVICLCSLWFMFASADCSVRTAPHQATKTIRKVVICRV